MIPPIKTTSFFFDSLYPHGLAGRIEFQDARCLEVTPFLSQDTKPFLQFFDASSPNWARICANVHQCIARHFEDPWSCYTLRESGSMVGVAYLELDFPLQGNLLFTPVLLDNDKELNLYVIGTWRWFAEQLLPTMHARGVTIPIFSSQGNKIAERSLEQATIRIAMDDDLRPALDSLRLEGFERENAALSNDYKISVRQILEKASSPFEEEEENNEEDKLLLFSEKKRCLLM